MNNAKPTARLTTPTDLGANAQKDITGALNALLADTFALFMKTKNFHWHVSGPHFRDYHLLLDEQAEKIYETTDAIGELREDNMQFTASLRETHEACDEHGDVATASLIENWIDEAEQRVWYLFEAGRRGEAAQR